MAKKVPINQLSKVIAKDLQQFSDDVNEITKEETKVVAKEATKQVKSKAPVKRGKYKKAITSKKIFENNLEIRFLVYVKGKFASLTHLLERGHLKWNGRGRTRPIPHWRYGEEYIHKNLVKKITSKIKKIK